MPWHCGSNNRFAAFDEFKDLLSAYANEEDPLFRFAAGVKPRPPLCPAKQFYAHAMKNDEATEDIITHTRETGSAGKSSSAADVISCYPKSKKTVVNE